MHAYSSVLFIFILWWCWYDEFPFHTFRDCEMSEVSFCDHCSSPAIMPLILFHYSSLGVPSKYIMTNSQPGMWNTPSIFHPFWCACAARITVLGLCMCVCPSVCLSAAILALRGDLWTIPTVSKLREHCNKIATFLKRLCSRAKKWIYQWAMSYALWRAQSYSLSSPALIKTMLTDTASPC